MGQPVYQESLWRNSMVQHVYERALLVPEVTSVIVATDDERVMVAVQDFGGQAIMTSTQHPSGTDRLTEVMQTLKADIYISLQCDEPLVRPEDISKLAQGMLADSSVQIGTLCHRLPASEADNPHLVKVVVPAIGDALYFSRSPIPYNRTPETACYFNMSEYMPTGSRFWRCTPGCHSR
ncbi:NTP transferase domain-containing protein [Desulfobulbus rhabdoformis]|uniref:cytidylyltransferase domain-containing protein n=1 Tax=Desulfobulbus rhabdoformis TaxID=34032 RepID=UPI001963805F|nr:NTP transferase domain-containing protein [Desulfobulbus rhabdoformis]MBM9613665.1 NTP transferase domain-containing protein [Desulfobulbus rhabdoformis]